MRGFERGDGVFFVKASARGIQGWMSCPECSYSSPKSLCPFASLGKRAWSYGIAPPETHSSTRSSAQDLSGPRRCSGSGTFVALSDETLQASAERVSLERGLIGGLRPATLFR
jgi:hypothetical protein